MTSKYIEQKIGEKLNGNLFSFVAVKNAMTAGCHIFNEKYNCCFYLEYIQQPYKTRISDAAGVHTILSAWGMNRAGLVDETILGQNIKAKEKAIDKLSKYTLTDFIDKADKIEPLLKELLEELCLKNNCGTRKITILTKSLHLLLPDLIIPMDGTYTLGYIFGKYSQRSIKCDELELLTIMKYHKQMANLYQKYKNKIDALQLPEECAHKKYPATKLLDNMIIFLHSHPQ